MYYLPVILLPPDVPLQRKTEKKKKTKQSDRASVTKKGEKKHEGVRSDLLSTAEELAGMMDENIGAKFDNIGVNAMANKDKAAEKQLKWEMERDLWVRGVDYKTKRKRGFKSKGKFGNQSQNKKKFKRK
ncbi:CCAAT/enhancer-binding protein zeta-like [Saccoglossus kowalevskii]